MIPEKIETQVVIIGAGPAGAGASIYLTKAGIPHVILEKQTFPRDKVCGDGCSGKTAFVLRKANPAWMNEIFQTAEQFMPSNGILLAAPNGKVLNIPYDVNRKQGDTPPGFTTRRIVFDNFLFEKLSSPYSTIYQNATLQNMERHAGKVIVNFAHEAKSYVLSARLIVGADGDKSEVRKIFLKSNQIIKADAVGLRAYYSGVTGCHAENFIELHFLKELLPGYLWIFPLPNGMANIGVCMPSERIRKNKINLRERMLHALSNNPTLNYRFTNAIMQDKIQGWGLPMGTKKVPVSGDHFLLVGDAAGLIDPFSGEGIGNALYSGMLSAYAVEKSLQSNNYNATFLKQQYDEVLYRRIGDELKISATLQRICRYPWGLNFVVNKATKSPSLGKTISSMFSDIDLRNQLRKPSFYAKILFNR